MNPTISLAPSGNLLLEIPSVLAEGRSHSVEIPLTLGGISLLKKILIERSRDPLPSIGKRSAPVAADISAFLEKQEREKVTQTLNKFKIEIDL